MINFDNYPGEVFVEPDQFDARPHAMRFWHRTLDGHVAGLVLGEDLATVRASTRRW